MADLPVDPNEYSTFMLYTGYVESGAVAPLIISMSDGPIFEGKAETWEKAWETSFLSMREALLKVVRLHHGFPADPDAVESDLAWAEDIAYCHKKFIDDQSYRYCPTCGFNLAKFRDDRGAVLDDELLSDMMYEFIRHMVAGTNDSTGYTSWEVMGSSGWTLGGWPEADGVVSCIFERAESFIVTFGKEAEDEHSVVYPERGATGFWDNVSLFRVSEIKGYGWPR